MKYKFECLEHQMRFKSKGALGAHKRYKHGAEVRKEDVTKFERSPGDYGKEYGAANGTLPEIIKLFSIAQDGVIVKACEIDHKLFVLIGNELKQCQSLTAAFSDIAAEDQ